MPDQTRRSHGVSLKLRRACAMRVAGVPWAKVGEALHLSESGAKHLQADHVEEWDKVYAEEYGQLLDQDEALAQARLRGFVVDGEGDPRTSEKAAADILQHIRETKKQAQGANVNVRAEAIAERSPEEIAAMVARAKLAFENVQGGEGDDDG